MQFKKFSFVKLKYKVNKKSKRNKTLKVVDKDNIYFKTLNHLNDCQKSDRVCLISSPFSSLNLPLHIRLNGI